MTKGFTKRDVPAVKGLAVRPSLDELIIKIKDVLGEGNELTRGMSLYICQRHSGAKLKAIGALFGISDAAVSQASRRLVLRAEKDKDLRKAIDLVEEKIGCAVSEVET